MKRHTSVSDFSVRPEPALGASAATFAERSAVRVYGDGERTLLFAHGFCCTQRVFEAQVRAFRDSHRVVTYDLAGFGEADASLWSARRYATLEGYALDLVRLIEELGLRRVTFVGASMSAMTGLIASTICPERFDALVFVAGSPRYLDDDGYVGGFDRAFLDAFYAMVNGRARWRDAVRDMLLGEAAAVTLEDVAQGVDCVLPDVVRVVGQAIFEADFRAWLPHCTLPVLVTQTRADAAVPEAVGRYLASTLVNARLELLPGVGHLPMRTEPEAFNAALRAFMARSSRS
ncbi:alpha/beta fold hydrolase [Deinococcus yavapaiensis]|uniref:Sigma-B regulation protein RsbQ n=1 Tax=Deinococcus yavapaiensis KR-236 TaxID=694435 RepID=A0A318SG07_9DEIO|nr:alpha/beta hydrolase [Deinococcus yavapaiensis]PYE55826.1 sigma-B regulation protein RsbQ [Deinococcus yavapaiensis KR-236]